MFCQKCGKELNDNANFCSKCGNRINATPVTPQPVTPQPVAPQPVAPQPVASQPVTPQPVVTQPVVTQPVAPQHVASQPVVTQPVAPQPVASQPVTPQPVTPQPVASQPVTPQPVASQPVTPQPTKIGNATVYTANSHTANTAQFNQPMQGTPATSQSGNSVPSIVGIVLAAIGLIVEYFLSVYGGLALIFIGFCIPSIPYYTYNGELKRAGQKRKIYIKYLIEAVEGSISNKSKLGGILDIITMIMFIAGLTMLLIFLNSY